MRPPRWFENFGAALLLAFPPAGSCLVSILENFRAAPQLTLSPSTPQIHPHPTLLSWSLLPSFPFLCPCRKKVSEELVFLSPALSLSEHLGRVLPFSSPQDSQLPLVVAMQERVGGSPHCKVTAPCVHQDVELSEKGGEKDVISRRLWSHYLSALHPTSHSLRLECPGRSFHEVGLDRPIQYHDCRQNMRSYGILSVASEICVCVCLLCRIIAFSMSSKPHYLCVWCVCVISSPISLSPLIALNLPCVPG